MKILLTNDDGYKAKGLLQLASALSDKHKVFICAPNGERSCAGHALTVWGDGLKVEQIDTAELTSGTDYEFTAPAIAISGTPADCTKFAVEGWFKDEKFDLVISGVNTVLNVGTDVKYSGTFNSAEEGALLGIPSVALSTVAESDDYSFPIEFLLENLDMFLKNLPPMTTLNINVPSQDKSKIKGVKAVPLGHRKYNDWYVEESDGFHMKGYAYDCKDSENADDCKYSDLGFITITPVRVLSRDMDLADLYDGEDWKL